MTISEKIFELIKERGMTQKEFAERTQIAQSTISDWKRKKTNPVSEKILTICDVLHVTPDELLSATEGKGHRSNSVDFYIVEKGTEEGKLIEMYQSMSVDKRNRFSEYLKMFK